jgi:hypothetical protein
MPKQPTVKLSKMDVGKRQIETAIRLWFASGDPVAIHTLTAAAHQIFHDIGKKQGVPTMLREIHGILPEYEKRAHELVRRYENFFKHADKDPDGLLDFNPHATELYMLDVVLTYELLTRELVPLFSTLKAWVFIQNPDLIVDSLRKKIIDRLKHVDLTNISRSVFFTLYLPVATTYERA